MRALIIGFFAVAMLMFAGLVSPQAKAAPTIPAVKQQSLVEDVRWRRRPVVRGRAVVRRPVVRGRAVVRRPVVRSRAVVRRPVVRSRARRTRRGWRW
jgi:hypothetical protein